MSPSRKLGFDRREPFASFGLDLARNFTWSGYWESGPAIQCGKLLEGLDAVLAITGISWQVGGSWQFGDLRLETVSDPCSPMF